MWTMAEFDPTALFSLRPANATVSGGKTLITPTPFAVKMALLDVAIRTSGREAGETWFPRLRDLKIAIRLPERVTVINTFVKILRPHKSGPRDTYGTGLLGPMGPTIAYRELVQFSGSLVVAVIPPGDDGPSEPLIELLAQVNYFGKRGSFMQFQGAQVVEELPLDFTVLNPSSDEPFQANGLLQLLDDCGPKMTFEHADIYSGKKISVDKPTGRILRSVVLPYRLARASRGFSLYERIPSPTH